MAFPLMPSPWTEFLTSVSLIVKECILNLTLLLVENSKVLVQHCGYPKHCLGADSGEDTQIHVTVLTPHQGIVKVIMELHFNKHVMN